jgi:colicin import membrane protein
MIELDAVSALANGLQGPLKFAGTHYFVLRISACGAAWRASKKEFVWRDPGIWLTPTMCARWAGAPVVVSHPKEGVLDTESFVNTVIGTIVRAFVRDGELLAVARILDSDAAAMLEAGQADTSPAVVLPEDVTEPVILKNGQRWLVERPPTLCDHLAVVPKGVWSQKSGTPGVQN